MKVRVYDAAQMGADENEISANYYMANGEDCYLQFPFACLITLRLLCPRATHCHYDRTLVMVKGKGVSYSCNLIDFAGQPPEKRDSHAAATGYCR
jgi:hypothetical protein